MFMVVTPYTCTGIPTYHYEKDIERKPLSRYLNQFDNRNYFDQQTFNHDIMYITHPFLLVQCA